MKRQTWIYGLLLLAVTVNGCSSSAQQSKVAPVNQQEKSAASAQTAPSPAANKNTTARTSLPAEPASDDSVTEWGKQTGGKTIRVEFSSNKRKQWLENETPVSAQFTTQSAQYKTSWIRGTTDVYLVKAQVGQTMTVKVSADEKKGVPNSNEDAAFDVFNARTNQRLEGGDQSWSLKLPETGDYAILVVGDHGNTDYTLKIEIH